jgi:hypothetical protein
MNRNIKKCLVFIGITFFFNYLMAFLFWVLGGKWTGTNITATIVGIGYMFIPMIVAIVVQKVIYNRWAYPGNSIAGGWSPGFCLQ